MTSRPAMSVSQVSPTTMDGANTERRTIPTRQTSRIGKGLVSSARVIRLVPDFGRRSASGASAWVEGVRLKSDSGATVLELTRESSRARRRACLDEGLGSPATPADGPKRAP